MTNLSTVIEIKSPNTQSHTTPVFALLLDVHSASGLLFDKVSNRPLHLKKIDFQEKNQIIGSKDQFYSCFPFAENVQMHFFLYSERTVLVPKNVYIAEEEALAYGFNYDFDYKTEELESDFLKSYDAQLIYSLPKGTKRELIYRFPKTKFHLHSESWLQGIYNSDIDKNGTILFADIMNANIQIAAFKNSQLQFFNIFQAKNPEDYLYYILFVMEQLQLNAKTCEVHLTGIADKNSNVYQLINKYIPHINLLSKVPIQLEDAFKESYNADFFKIYSTLLCV